MLVITKPIYINKLRNGYDTNQSNNASIYIYVPEFHDGKGDGKEKEVSIGRGPFFLAKRQFSMTDFEKNKWLNLFSL